MSVTPLFIGLRVALVMCLLAFVAVFLRTTCVNVIHIHVCVRLLVERGFSVTGDMPSARVSANLEPDTLWRGTWLVQGYRAQPAGLDWHGCSRSAQGKAWLSKRGPAHVVGL